MSVENFEAPTNRGTVLNSQLDALSNGAYSAAGTEINNSTNLDRFASAELVVDFVSAPNAESTVSLFMVCAPDGTNYADSGTPSPTAWVGDFVLQATTAAQRVSIPRFELLPFKTKFLVKNESGQAFPASGSTVVLHTFNRELN